MKNNNTRKDIFILLTWYSVAYLLYYFILTFVPYNSKDQTGIISACYSGILANDWLQNDLMASLQYLHARPPLSCVYWGLLLKLSPSYCILIHYIIHFLTGAIAVSLLYVTMMRLGISRISNIVTSTALVTLPGLFVYETTTATTHFEFCLFATVLYFLSGFYIQPEKRKHLIGLFLTFAVLGLLRAQWHLLVLLTTAVIIFLLENKALRKRIALLSLIFIIPLCAWYTKTNIQFGVWGTSSWMGSNISQAALRVAIRYLPLSEIRDMRDRHEIAQDFPAMFVPSTILRRVPPSTIASYDSACLSPFIPGHDGDIAYFNYNYPGVITSSLTDLHDSKVIIKKHPFLYLRGVCERILEVSSTPSIGYDMYPMLLGTYTHSFINGAVFVFYLLIPIMIFMGVILFPTDFSPSTRKFVVVTFYFAMAMLFISCACNGSEQERMRWGQAPVYFVYVALLMDVVGRNIGKYFHKIS